MLCCGGVLRQCIEHGKALINAGLAIGDAQHLLGIGFMVVLLKVELAGKIMLDDGRALPDPTGIVRPTCQYLCQGDHIVLGVTTIDAKGVEFEDLAREIFVDVGVLAPVARVLRIGRIRPDGDLVFEVRDHRRMLIDGLQQVGELAEHPGTDDIPFHVASRGHHQVAFAAENRKVVGPEVHESFGEADIRFQRLCLARCLLGVNDLRGRWEEPSG